jgi:hypothetical protein
MTNFAGVAERSKALDCKSSGLVPTEVQILSPASFFLDGGPTVKMEFYIAFYIAETLKHTRKLSQMNHMMHMNQLMQAIDSMLKTR